MVRGLDRRPEEQKIPRCFYPSYFFPPLLWGGGKGNGKEPTKIKNKINLEPGVVLVSPFVAPLGYGARGVGLFHWRAIKYVKGKRFERALVQPGAFWVEWRRHGINRSAQAGQNEPNKSRRPLRGEKRQCTYVA